MRFFTIASVLFTTVVSVFASPVIERQAPQSVAVILTDLSSTVTPLANQLREQRARSYIVFYYLADDCSLCYICKCDTGDPDAYHR